MSSATSLIQFADPELFRDPHPVLHHARANAPVHWSQHTGAWILLRYDDIRDGLMDPRLASTAMSRRIERYTPAEQHTVAELREMVERWMGLPTAEDHRRYSTLLRPRFAASPVAAMEPQLTAHADALWDAMARQGGGDVVRDFAAPYAIGTVCRLCGLPASREITRIIARWVRDLAAVFHFSDLAGLQRAQLAAREMAEFLREQVTARRRDPQDDVVSVLLDGLESGLIHDEEEIIANLVMILAVGFETTSNLIAAGVFLLLTHGAQLTLLREDTGRCAGAVEEIARYEGPVFFTTRVAREHLQLGAEHAAEPGDLVLLCLAAANRDPARFSRPDDFLVTRNPSPHLGFGAGTYSCLGARLARAECRIAFHSALRTLPGLELAGEPGWYEFPPLARWLDQLPVTCTSTWPAQ